MSRAIDSGRVWRLAVPVILGSISVPLLGTVDTAVVGQMEGPENIGGVAIGASIITFVYWCFGFLRMSTTGFAAQALGAHAPHEVRAVLARAILLAVGLGLAIVILQVPILWAALSVMAPSEAVAPLAYDYASVRLWAAPASLANLAFLGWFLGVQNTRAALVLQIAMNGVNILLAVWFVLGLGWGVKGVAFATVLAEVFAILLGQQLAKTSLKGIGGAWRRAFILDVAKLRRMIAVNRDILIRTLCLLMAFTSFTALGSRLGDQVLAANAVLLVFQSLMAYGLDGFAYAAEALVGQAIGATRRDAFREAVRQTTAWAFGLAVLYALFYLLAGGLLIDILTADAGVRETAKTFLPWLVLSPLLSVWSFQLDGIFIGATRGPAMRNAMLLSVACYGLAVAVFLPLLGNHGLWLSLMVLMIARATSLALHYPALERSVQP
jgi:MATE family multidrug resistance protein